MSRQSTLSATLARLRRLVRLAMLTGGVGRFLCLAVALAALHFALDRWLRLPFSARAFLLAGIACVLLWQAARGVVLPLLRRLPDGALAVEVERRRGGMDDLLSSALSFRVSAESAASVELQRAIVVEAEEVAADLDAATILDWRRARNRFLLGLGLLCLLAAAALLRTGTATLWFRRAVFLSSAEWPRRTRLELLGFEEDGVRYIAHGADAQVSARARGVVPGVVQLRLRVVETGAGRAFPMTRVSRDTFSATLERVTRAVELRATGGDGRSEQVQLLPVQRPRIVTARMLVDPPDYIAKEPVEVAWHSAEVRVPRGSWATLEAQASKPLSGGFFRIDGSEPRPLRLVGPDVARCSFRVEDTVHCEMTFADRHGIWAEAPLRVAVHGVPDKPPQVRLSAPGVGSMAVPRARIPLAVRVEDDYGITEAWLDVRVDGDGEVREFPGLGLAEGETERILDLEQQLDLEEMGLEEGERLSIVASARDNRPEPNVGQANPIVLRLVSVQRLLRAMLLRQEDLRRDLEESIERQRELVENVAGADGEALRRLAWTESDISEQLVRLADAYGAVLEEMRVNRVLTGSALRARTAEIVEPLAALSRPGAALRLAAERLSAAGRDALQPARRAAVEMEEVRSHMLLMEGFAALAVSVEEIGDHQQAILERTRERQRRALRRIGED